MALPVEALISFGFCLLLFFISCRTSEEESQRQLHPGQPFKSQGGLFAEEAIKLLQDFYIAGNPAGGGGGGRGRHCFGGGMCCTPKWQ
jgi:hypothetical protein